VVLLYSKNRRNLSGKYRALIRVLLDNDLRFIEEFKEVFLSRIRGLGSNFYYILSING